MIRHQELGEKTLFHGHLNRILSILCIPPLTPQNGPLWPIGLPRKHLFQENRPNLREITQGEDVEMFDMEQQDHGRTPTLTPVEEVISNSSLDVRKHIKGRRRINTVSCETDASTSTSVDRVPSDRVLRVVESQEEKSDTKTEPNDVNKLKGISIKYLRQKGGKRQQPKNVGEKNYKVTRKKPKKSSVDSSQRLIHSYYNKIVVGSNDEDNPQGHLED